MTRSELCRVLEETKDIPTHVERNITIKTPPEIAAPNKGMPMSLLSLHKAITMPMTAKTNANATAPTPKTPKNGIQQINNPGTAKTTERMPKTSDGTFLTVGTADWAAQIGV